MSQPYTCRRLAASDIGALRALLRVFADAFEDRATYLSDQPTDVTLTQRLSRRNIVIVTAHASDDTVVGGLVAYVLDKIEQPRSEIYIYDLAVSEAHRRNGVARSLIRHLQSLAPEFSAWVIYVQADPEDEPAVALYQSLGIQERVFHFDFPVPPHQA